MTEINSSIYSLMYLEQVLRELSATQHKRIVFIPGLWYKNQGAIPIKINYSTFLKHNIEEIASSERSEKLKREVSWTEKAVVYNVFIRFFTAYDHDHDGLLGKQSGDITINKDGIRETGTFLKTIALMPYLKSLGINTIHLLPITQIGIDGRKGDLGSPYAIKNPLEIDPNLADPIVDLSAEIQYKALIEAAHILNMRIVQEFIFRTASIDSDWSIQHPEWFYWIKKNKAYGPPKFTPRALAQILKVPKGKGKFIPPEKSYRNLFIQPKRNADYQNLKIASAFADWPPNDLQPPWSDVTYLRLYNYDKKKDNNYNYIAYNTIRFYDPELAKQEHINHDVWNKIIEIIPYYQKEFGIDGAMIDMGHALPNELKSRIILRARSIDPAFAFWDENFDNKKETKKDGYNTVIGDAWYKITRRNGFRNIISAAKTKTHLPYFGTAETHNSPRFGNRILNKKKSAWLLFNVLPNSIPFLHNGFELNEHLPVNTGLNFSKEEIECFSNQRLALFHKTSLNWENQSTIVSFIRKISHIKSQYPWIFSKKPLSILQTDNPKVLGFEIKEKERRVIILFNTNFYKKEIFSLDKRKNMIYHDLLHDKSFRFDNKNEVERGGIIMAIQI